MNKAEQTKEAILINTIKEVLMGLRSSDNYDYNNEVVSNFFTALKGEAKKEFRKISSMKELIMFLDKYTPLSSDVRRTIHNCIIPKYFNKDFFNQEFCLCADYGYQGRFTKYYKKTHGCMKSYSLDQHCARLRVDDPNVSNYAFGYRFETRDYLEYNPYLAQISVGAIIETSDDKLVFLECIHGDLDGKITLVQGHSSYINPNNNEFLEKFYYDFDDDNITFDQLSEFNKMNIVKECCEEIYDKYTKNHTIKEYIDTIEHLCYVPIMPEDNTKVSAYHMGEIFIIKLKSSISYSAITGEPNKHNLIFRNKNDAKTILDGKVNNEKFDDWAQFAMIEYFKREATLKKANK
ncbi:MAG: hypothetical protein SPF22_08280 [Candidatus Onthovivens sp.]|nr:hypothetical protein [Candidatus Onthovivens sp.]